MSCNKITVPEFTKEQIAECLECNIISGRKRWCGHFGVWIRENNEKIIPKRIRLRRHKMAANKARPCNEQSLRKDYETTKKRRQNYPAVVSGKLKFISLSDYIKRRIDCHNCNEPNCSIWKGCCGWMKLIYENTKCPKGKGQVSQIAS